MPGACLCAALLWLICLFKPGYFSKVGQGPPGKLPPGGHFRFITAGATMTSPGTSPGSDLGAGPRVRDPLPRWRRVFPGRDDQVREVRRWLTALLPGVPERDAAVVVAVELVTNAIRHTASGRGGLIMVEVTWCGPVLRIAVADDGAPGGPRLAAAPGGPAAARGGLAESGRGLHLVRALAASTGVCGDPRGRLVWADIAWTGPRPAAPQLP